MDESQYIMSHQAGTFSPRFGDVNEHQRNIMSLATFFLKCNLSKEVIFKIIENNKHNLTL